MRIKWVDCAKGISILLVLLGHVLLGLSRSGRFEEWNNALLLVINFIYGFHMPMFFALSGMFFKQVKSFGQLKAILKTKFISLGVPYVCFSVIMVALQYIGGDSVRESAGIYDLINIYREPIGYLWFLYVLFFVYLYLGILSIVLKKEKYIIVVLLCGYLMASVLNFPVFFLQRTLVWAPLFYSGHLLKNKKLKINYLSILAIAFYCLRAPLFKILNPLDEYVSQSNPQLWIIFSFLGIYIGFVFIPKIKGKIEDAFSFIGKDSLVVYLVHAPAASVIRIVLFKLGINGLALHIVIGTVLSLTISLFAIYMMKKIRIVRCIFYPSRY